MRSRYPMLGVLLLVSIAITAAEEAALITSHLATAPRIDVPHAAFPPAVDADPGDPAWAAGALITGLAAAGEDLARPTTVHLLWDADALYVRFLAEDDDIFTPFGTSRDANHYEGDVAELFLDPLGDARQYYEIQVTPRGGVLDLNMLLTADPVADSEGALHGPFRDREFWSLRSWDMAGLRHAQRELRDAAGQTVGWIVDLAIPANAVMKRHGGKQLVPLTLRANFARYEWAAAAPAGEERQLTAMYWAPVPRGRPHVSPLAMGELVLLPATE
jgi:hypothetical protein